MKFIQMSVIKEPLEISESTVFYNHEGPIIIDSEISFKKPERPTKIKCELFFMAKNIYNLGQIIGPEANLNFFSSENFRHEGRIKADKVNVDAGGCCDYLEGSYQRKRLLSEIKTFDKSKSKSIDLPKKDITINAAEAVVSDNCVLTKKEKPFQTLTL